MNDDLKGCSLGDLQGPIFWSFFQGFMGSAVIPMGSAVNLMGWIWAVNPMGWDGIESSGMGWEWDWKNPSHGSPCCYASLSCFSRFHFCPRRCEISSNDPKISHLMILRFITFICQITLYLKMLYSKINPSWGSILGRGVISSKLLQEGV